MKVNEINIPVINSWKDARMHGSGRCYRGKYFWQEHTLWEYCRLQEYEPFEVPIAAIPLDVLPWNINNIEDIAYHIKKVNESDLNYPIILDDWGNIRDGYHRLVKALMQEDKTIKVIRMLTMPEPDGKDDE